MNFRLLAVLPLVALMAAPVHAGALGTTVTEPEVRAPVVPLPPAGGLSTAALIGGGVVAVVVLGSLLNDNDTPATTTNAP